jgi:hypothetical protein
MDKTQQHMVAAEVELAEVDLVVQVLMEEL